MPDVKRDEIEVGGFDYRQLRGIFPKLSELPEDAIRRIRGCSDPPCLFVAADGTITGTLPCGHDVKRIRPCDEVEPTPYCEECFALSKEPHP